MRIRDIPDKTLSTKFLGINFPNPLIIPSGIIQDVSGFNEVIKAGVGGVVGKSFTVSPREGNPIPRIIKYKDIGILNSVGLRNPGIAKGILQLNAFIKESTVPVIASIFASSIKDFKFLAHKILEVDTSLVELNLSCPNTTSELGKPMGMGVESSYKAVSAVRKIVKNKKKLIAKLSPNVPNIGEVARAAEDAGADAISAINTVGPGMHININTRKPTLGNYEGGMSGPIIKPLAIRCVYDIYRSVKIPIIGMGGISSWEDTVEMMLAGATLVGVGSAWYYNKNVYREISLGVAEFIKKTKAKSLKEIVGIANQ